MFYGMSHDPEYYDKKVNLVIALSPCTRMKYTKNMMITGGSTLYGKIEDFIDKYGIWAVNSPQWVKHVNPDTCADKLQGPLKFGLCTISETSCGTGVPIKNFLHMY